MTLPPLPESVANGDNTCNYFGDLFEYTAKEMTAYGEESSCRYRDALEAIKRAVGTSSSAWHIAERALNPPAVCAHDWPEKDGQTDLDGRCTKCSMSFQYHIHVECP